MVNLGGRGRVWGVSGRSKVCVWGVWRKEVEGNVGRGRGSWGGSQWRE